MHNIYYPDSSVTPLARHYKYRQQTQIIHYESRPVQEQHIHIYYPDSSELLVAGAWRAYLSAFSGLGCGGSVAAAAAQVIEMY